MKCSTNCHFMQTMDSVELKWFCCFFFCCCCCYFFRGSFIKCLHTSNHCISSHVASLSFSFFLKSPVYSLFFFFFPFLSFGQLKSMHAKFNGIPPTQFKFIMITKSLKVKKGSSSGNLKSSSVLKLVTVWKHILFNLTLNYSSYYHRQCHRLMQTIRYTELSV